MNIEPRTTNSATIAALLLFAASTSTTPALADDPTADQANDAAPTQIEEASREQARQANETAVEEAAKAVETDIRLDLDITLNGHTSVLIAGDQ